MFAVASTIKARGLTKPFYRPKPINDKSDRKVYAGVGKILEWQFVI